MSPSSEADVGGGPAASTRRSYDRVAGPYALRFAHELDDKPFDCEFLDAVVGVGPHDGWWIDLGSGPSQIGAYLATLGLAILSIDISEAMLRRASALVPSGHQVQADMRSLAFADESIAGIVAFYSLIHIPPKELEATLTEIGRVLMPGGHLAVTVHTTPPTDAAGGREVAGARMVHVDEMLSETVDLDFYFYGSDQLTETTEAARLELVRCCTREPYGSDVEAQTRRAYLIARKDS